jgi:glycosyltransferase involved in cell wall biosynthesis
MENGKWKMENGRSSNTLSDLPTPPPPTPYDFTTSRLHDYIERLPSVTDEQLSDLYRTASAVLYPSWYEGFGLPLHEAARYGTPCLASIMGSLPETAPTGTVFAPPAKPHLWAAMLRDMLTSPERYRTTFDESLAKTDISVIVDWLKRVGLSV